MTFISSKRNATYEPYWVSYKTTKKYSVFQSVLPGLSLDISQRNLSLDKMIKACDSNSSCAGFTYDVQRHLSVQQYNSIVLDVLESMEDSSTLVQTWVKLNSSPELIEAKSTQVR